MRAGSWRAYVWEPDLPRAVAPRPYLHPVTTLGGTVVTGFRPADHPHHLGASVAVPVLNDVNFWVDARTSATAGRSCSTTTGPSGTPGGCTGRHDRLVQELVWTGGDGRPVAREERSLAACPVTDGVWLLRVGFTLAAPDGTALTIDSPGARGRAGAGYGGFFWRAPDGSRRVRAFGAGDAPSAPDTAGAGGAGAGGDRPGAGGPGGAASAGDRPGAGGPGGAGPGGGAGGAGAPSAPSPPSASSAESTVDGVHGSRRSWVALSGRQPGAGPWTLVFLAERGGRSDPWFVRSDDYAGVCSAVAWDRPLVVAAGDALVRRLGVLVADGRLTAEAVEAAVAAARTVSA